MNLIVRILRNFAFIVMILICLALFIVPALAFISTYGEIRFVGHEKWRHKCIHYLYRFGDQICEYLARWEKACCEN